MKHQTVGLQFDFQKSERAKPWKTALPIVGVPLLAAVLLLPLSAGAGLVIGRAFSPRRAKKKFVITGRVKRLYVVFFLVMTGISALCAATPWAVLPALWPLALPLVVA
mgnify:CR=1 FL=1